MLARERCTCFNLVMQMLQQRQSSWKMSFALVALGPMPGPHVQVSHVWCERMGNSQTKHIDTMVSAVCCRWARLVED